MDGAATEVLPESVEQRVERLKVERLKEKLDARPLEAARIEVELSRAEGAIKGVPHYCVIEGRAHRLGRSLSRQVQQQQMNELAATAAATAKCPVCGKSRELSRRSRRVTTIDGETSLQEVVGTCCRKKAPLS